MASVRPSLGAGSAQPASRAASGPTDASKMPAALIWCKVKALAAGQTDHQQDAG